jgi:hypothetical protein
MEVQEQKGNLFKQQIYLHVPEEQTFVLQSKSLRLILSGMHSFSLILFLDLIKSHRRLQLSNM